MYCPLTSAAESGYLPLTSYNSSQLPKVEYMYKNGCKVTKNRGQNKINAFIFYAEME